MERYYSLKEAARITGRPYRTLWHWCRYGGIEHTMMMEKYALTEAQLTALKQKKKVVKKAVK